MRDVFGSCNFSVLKYLHFFNYFLCINLTVKIKKERVCSVFTHRVSWDGSRKLTTFKIELLLIIVNGLRLSLKIWQGSWFLVPSLLLLHTSVSSFCFILKEFKLQAMQIDIFGFCIGEYREYADAKVRRHFKI